MNLLLRGATGRTGRLVLDKPLARGHAVAAIFRQPGALPSRGRLQAVVGDPFRSNVLVPVLANRDAVISCLGQRSREDANLLHDSAVAILEAMARSSARRYLVVSMGLLFPDRNPGLALLRMILARHIADSAAMERVVCASKVGWTIVRPPRLKETSAWMQA
jgi:putative NADH-flavin reductase